MLTKDYHSFSFVGKALASHEVRIETKRGMEEVGTLLY